MKKLIAMAAAVAMVATAVFGVAPASAQNKKYTIALVPGLTTDAFYITMRKGTIYMGTGTITRIVSTTPQMAIMNIGTDNFEKLVMLENSSKTTWTIGTKYRIYGEAYGLYDTMPRLTVRYTYLVE